MKHSPIICRNCGRAWPSPRPYTLHQRLALEASPCPACGAATLCCPDPNETERRDGERDVRRRPTRFVAIRKPDEQAA